MVRRVEMEHATLIIDKIEEIREDRGMSIAELARRIHVDRKRLWNVLRYKRNMHIDEFVRICAVFDVNPRCFITPEMAAEFKSWHHKMIDDYGTGSYRFWNVPYLLK